MYRLITVIITLLFTLTSTAEPLSSGFTYQGVLNLGGVPANGAFDFQFELYDVSTGGVALVSPVLLDDIEVSGGVFSVELDFGTDVFNGQQLWLEISAREGPLVGEYSTLSPRQKLTASPYALNALDTVNTPVPSSGPDRMIVLGDDAVNGFQAFPFTSINSLWCRISENRIEVSYIRISDNQIFSAVVDSDPVDFGAACQAWLDYLNGDGPQPPINP